MRAYQAACLAVWLLCAGLAGCQVAPNPGETTPPTILFHVTDKLNGDAVTDLTGKPNTITQFNPQFDILIAASGTDNGGMQSLGGYVEFYSDSCAGGTVINPYYDTLANISETATVNPPGTVTTVLPFLLEVNTGRVQAFACGAGPARSSGIGTIIVVVTATNAAGKQASGSWYLRIGDGALPQQ